MPFKNGLNLAANIESLLLNGDQHESKKEEEAKPQVAVRSGFR